MNRQENDLNENEILSEEKDETHQLANQSEANEQNRIFLEQL